MRPNSSLQSSTADGYQTLHALYKAWQEHYVTSRMQTPSSEHLHLPETGRPLYTIPWIRHVCICHIHLLRLLDSTLLDSTCKCKQVHFSPPEYQTVIDQGNHNWVHVKIQVKNSLTTVNLQNKMHSACQLVVVWLTKPCNQPIVPAHYRTFYFWKCQNRMLPQKFPYNLYEALLLDLPKLFKQHPKKKARDSTA